MSDSLENLLGVGSRVKHPAYGDGVIIRLQKAAYEVSFMLYGIKPVGKTFTEWEVVERIEPFDEVSFSPIEEALERVLTRHMDIGKVISLGDKWKGGTLSLQPEDENLQAKEMPVETFFNKIIMIRDRVRVMEQRINSSNLTEEEKVNLQQYITRIYGSLTSFNVLFKYKDDHFKGAGRKIDY